MPSIQIPAASADLTANGSAAGYATVTSNAAFYPGAKGWLQDDDGARRILIVSLSSTDKIYVRFIRDENDTMRGIGPSYGYSDISAYTTAKHSRIYQDAGLAPVDPAFSKKASVP